MKFNMEKKLAAKWNKLTPYQRQSVLESLKTRGAYETVEILIPEDFEVHPLGKKPLHSFTKVVFSKENPLQHSNYIVSEIL